MVRRKEEYENRRTEQGTREKSWIGEQIQLGWRKNSTVRRNEEKENRRKEKVRREQCRIRERIEQGWREKIVGLERKDQG